MGGVIIIVFIVCYSIAQILSKIECLSAVHYSSTHQMTAPAPNSSQSKKKVNTDQRMHETQGGKRICRNQYSNIVVFQVKIVVSKVLLEWKSKERRFRQTGEGREARPGKLWCEDEWEEKFEQATKQHRKEPSQTLHTIIHKELHVRCVGWCSLKSTSSKFLRA